jgi:hypothetical protein
VSDVETTVVEPVDARLLRGRETLHLDGKALFDRVINLKFKRKNGRSFIIRSDYEPVYRRDGSVFFKRCLQKPQIKVSYTQVPGNTVIACDIEVTNLFVDPRLDGLVQEESSLGEGKKAVGATKQGEESLLEENGDPVREITLQMGYVKQFPDWSKPGMADTDEKLRRFFDLDNHVYNNNPQAGTAVELRLSVLTTQSRGLPPDRVTTFQCYVGSLLPGLVWEHEDSDLLSGYGDITFPSPDATPLEKTFFMLVSRRFLSPALRRSVERSPDGKDVALLVEEPFLDREGKTLYADASKKSPVRVPLAPDGCLTTDDAVAIGVHCYVSKKLREAVGDTTDTFIGSLLTDLTSSRFKVAPLIEQQRLVSGQIKRIQLTYPRVRWFVLNNGDYFFYDKDETSKELFEDPLMREKRRQETVTLPAIYDITMDAMRVVRAPFHGFINPYTTIRVNARYNLGTLVGFYYPKQSRRWLTVVTQKVEFSTTGDENVMELSCVELDPGDAVEYNETTRQTTITRASLAKAGAERESRFVFEIMDWPVLGTDGAHSRLEWLAGVMARSAGHRSVSKAWEESDKVPSVPLAIKVLLERNKSLLDTQARKDRGNSPEYRKYRAELNELGVFHVPYIYESFEGAQDVIKCRLPWAPDDDGTLGDVLEEQE